ncbi:MAG: hypothetical protein Q4F00_13115 [bacterium]|nr:hypothetical protein [bacterium]
MKRIATFCCALGLMCTGLAQAHWMPKEEMKVGGIGAGSTLAEVEKTFGKPQKIKRLDEGWIRVVIYEYSPDFQVTARVPSEEKCSEKNMPVVGFRLRNNSLATPSGITVGMPYSVVEGKFGAVERSTDEPRASYSYQAKNSAVEMTFYVDDHNVITEIYEGSEL